MDSRIKIALDGPAASGKTTVARALAQRLGLALVDTGAMYRAVALAALEQGVAASDPSALEALARDIAAGFEFLPDPAGHQGFRLLVQGVDVTVRLHEAAVSACVSQVAAVAGVRRLLSAQQRRIGLQGGVVMTGRDIGTVVLPEAELKVFMTASPEERARRRVLDVLARGEGSGLDAEALQASILASIIERDRIDSTRAEAPLAQAADAVLVDTTALSLDEVVEALARLVDERPSPAPEGGQEPARAGAHP